MLWSGLSAMRMHQWAKNLLIFLPLLLAHVRRLAGRLLSALLAFFCFSLTASSAYIVNDLLDIEADRRHPAKAPAPLCRGRSLGLCRCLHGGRLSVFGVPGRAPAARWPSPGGCCSIWQRRSPIPGILKRIALVDVLVLSGLYTLRLFAGSAATESHISHWLAGFSVFLFFSLAMVKRFAELQNLRTSGLPPRNGRGYLVADTDQLRSFGTASAFAAVMVFAIYISSSDVVVLYRRAQLLWLIMPLMILWLCRVWLLASRGELDEDPLRLRIH